MQPGSSKTGRPGLIVRLTPAGPWRIGPDSGARNHVDPVYHSDTLYGAVSAAMDRLGAFDEWLQATTRRSVAAVAFSSCFPFVEEVNLVVPPRTLWPPSSPALLSSRVRWKSARFVPLSLIPSLVAGAPLSDSQWSVDGPSQCLLPAGKPGPFRSSLRFHTAVDRLTGSGERHSVACLEFRPGAGLWTLVSFADEAARECWSDRVKAAFRLLADSGFGGERSQGWGHAAAPDFTEGWLPEMILPAAAPKPAEATVRQSADMAPLHAPPAEPPSPSRDREGAVEPPPAPNPESASSEPIETASPSRDREGTVAEQTPTSEAIEHVAAEQSATAGAEPAAVESTEPAIPDQPARDIAEASVRQSPEIAPLPAPTPDTPAQPAAAHWLLSLFTPAPADAVDWTRGNYTLVARAGRVASSGELKKTAQLVAEGSVLYAASAPGGSAQDVAPDGATHPVFRAGFAVSVRLPEVG
ncbi:MAG: type III-A CRISPR-associated RAMP protein Csm4 [Bryobacteraceae bacterium]